MIFYPPLLKRGICVTPWLALIPRWARNNVPYHAHEACHAEQQRKVGTVTFWWRYLTDKNFRKWAEVAAYQMQMGAGGSLNACAHDLVAGYGLGITFEQAVELLA